MSGTGRPRPGLKRYRSGGRDETVPSESMLLGESRILTAPRRATKAPAADETLICLERGSAATLRFAGGKIHQNFHEENLSICVKVACAGRTGISTTCSISHESLMRAIRTATTIARVAAKQVPPAFSTKPPTDPTQKLTTHFPTTAHEPVAKAVRMIRHLSNRSTAHEMDLAGSFVAGEDELAVVGSRGLSQYQPFSIAGLRLVATKGKSSGFASQAVRNMEVLDPEALLKRAWDFCRLNKNPKQIPIGKYDVLLEPEAVEELAQWLSCIGFGAKQMVERTGFMSGRLGQKIMSPMISIADDGTNEEGLAAPFDYEGTPKRPVALIDQGVAAHVVYDSQYAKLHKQASTGHAMAYDEFEGPLATNLFLAPGTTPHAQMLKKMKRGLWISRFHYVSGLLKTQEALMTGLTRDGTFIVQNGKVVGAAKNLRFTQSILEAFSKVLAVSKERRLVADPSQGLSAVVTPALLLKDFTFTGQTK